MKKFKKFLRLIIAIAILPLWLYWVILAAIIELLMSAFYWVSKVDENMKTFTPPSLKDRWITLYRWVGG